MTALEVQDLSFSYGDRRALDAFTLSVAEKEIFGILGPNGGGKTTLFRILSTLFPLTSGTVRFFGASLRDEPEAVRRNLGIVFQAPSLDARLSVRENLRHQGHMYGLCGKELVRRSEEMLRSLKLWDRRDEKVGTLSGGLARRAEIAKALLHEPKFLLLDEPTVGLDPGIRKEVWDLLADLREKRGLTILLTTHLLDEAEKCDRIAILDLGKLLTVGTPAALKSALHGDVLFLQTANPARLAEGISKTFDLPPIVYNGTVRVEHPDGLAALTKILSAFPGEVTEVSMRKPTLEDVFVQKTGHRFEG